MSVNQILRPARKVGNGCRRHINSKIMIKRRENFVESHRTLDYFPAQALCGADDLSRLHPPAGQQTTRNLWPMIAASVFVDRRGSSEFAPNHDGHILVQASIMQILNRS